MKHLLTLNELLLLMTPAQFDFVIKHANFDEKNVEALHRIFVRREHLADVAREMKLSRPRMSQMRAHFIAHFERLLNDHELVFTEVLLTKNELTLVRKIEEERLANLAKLNQAKKE